ADRLHGARLLVDRDHRRLEDDDALAALVDDRVRGAEVDRQVVAPAEWVVEGHLPEGSRYPFVDTGGAGRSIAAPTGRRLSEKPGCSSCARQLRPKREPPTGWPTVRIGAAWWSVPGSNR